jgi:hypothetical protein
LELRQAKHLPAWLISPSSPFDFTRLVELDTDGHNTDSDLLRILSSARLSIRQLRMTESKLSYLYSFFPRSDVASSPGLAGQSVGLSGIDTS